MKGYIQLGVVKNLFSVFQRSNRHEHTHLLKLTRSFIQPVKKTYRKLAGRLKAISDKYYKGSEERQGWRKKYFDEYVEAVKAWKRATVAVQEKYKGLTDDKLTHLNKWQNVKRPISYRLGVTLCFVVVRSSDGFKAYLTLAKNSWASMVT